MKHTPGKWFVDENDWGIYIGSDKRNGWHCSMMKAEGISYTGDIEEDRANARLISACPDLLEACKFAQAVLDGYDPPVDDEPYNRFTEGMKQLRQAIAKAEQE
ncbi:MAG: hypothetical protein EHM49_00745 [Deltaproteobacteria bacterium]|nr:MAG: hypothetical protein EHM49_00745 [Deltaproteobacteria bacterium]